MAHPRPTLDKQRISDSPKATPSGRHSNDSPEANLEWDIHSRLAPRPTSGRRCNHDSPKANLGQAVHFRLTPGHLGRCSRRCPTPPINSTDHIYKVDRLTNSPSTKVQRWAS